MRCNTHLCVHLIWATEDRLPLITPRMRHVLYPYIRARAEQCNCAVLAVGGMPDHIHVVVRLHPSIPVSRIVGEMKGASSHRVNHLENWSEPKLYWQRGYSAFSFWQRDQRIVIQYVERQREHHALDHWVQFAPETFDAIMSRMLLVEAWEKTPEDECSFRTARRS